MITNHSHLECFRIVPNISLNLEQEAQRNRLQLERSNANSILQKRAANGRPGLASGKCRQVRKRIALLTNLSQLITVAANQAGKQTAQTYAAQSR
jgi:hypothetical protein